MSVYKNDVPSYVRIALDSILIKQSIKPSEIILVQDGPLPHELSTVLIEYEQNYPEIMHVIKLKKNGGLGNALRIGVKFAKNDIVARMDSDDISLPNRFERQLAYLMSHPECDIVGGQITEFISSYDNIVGSRLVPLSNDEIYQYMKRRCGLNHVTVMFRKESVLQSGNYQDWFCNEDYYLWIRMMLRGCKFANLPDTLVNVRVGRDMYARRGGWLYFKSEFGIQRYMWEHKLIGLSLYIYNVSIRFVLQVVMPNCLRGWVFRIFARKQVEI